ncbi:rho guanine nucleotide exchange factor 10-like [Paramuricea clavata]|uniref:Rho guanine nucleotide exchange factor 10-like n=1 Tax=Paramuricea clavata TaxID=317549 RepID=A0A7D9DTA7_PARCT|nr:rho guanine nucleotide exchange factor 10-like [Paramuricea clavata]
MKTNQHIKKLVWVIVFRVRTEALLFSSGIKPENAFPPDEMSSRPEIIRYHESRLFDLWLKISSWPPGGPGGGFEISQAIGRYLAKGGNRLKTRNKRDDRDNSHDREIGNKNSVNVRTRVNLIVHHAIMSKIPNIHGLLNDLKLLFYAKSSLKHLFYRLTNIEQELRDRKLSEDENLDVMFCSLQSILQSHEMFSMVLAARMNEWTVEGRLGDIICASFSKSTTTMAYTDFVNNFLEAIDTFRAVCKNNSVFSQYVQAKINVVKPKTTFHDLMLKPFERFPEFIILVQDLLEVTPVSHVDRVPLQLALTQLECLAELINSRRKEGEMKSQLKYLDTQISQLNKPLSSSGRVFIRQDDMIHCVSFTNLSI